MRFIFVAILMFSSTSFAWLQAPYECSENNKYELFYAYELLSFKLDSQVSPKNINVELEVTHYICDRKKIDGKWNYEWELVGDKTFTVHVSNGTKAIGNFKYKKTETKYIYNSQIQIPIESMLTVDELRELKNGNSLKLDKHLYFKHHSNFGWSSLSFYILNFKLNLETSKSSVELVNWGIAGRN